MNYNIVSIIAVVLWSLGLIGHHSNIQKESTVTNTWIKTNTVIPPKENPTQKSTTTSKQIEKTQNGEQNKKSYPLHSNIITTTFWVGEGESDENGYITNVSSARDEKRMQHFGGIDDPNKRNGYKPSTFQPKENPFYFALPYNDLDHNGKRKKNIENIVYWATEKKRSDNESMLKNRRIKITANNKISYAQRQDVWPFLEDDASYVFWSASPSNTQLEKAGLDVSPAVADYLWLDGSDTASRQFVNQQDVPSWPRKEIVTTSQIYWE